MRGCSLGFRIGSLGLTVGAVSDGVGALHRMIRAQKNRSNDTPVLKERLQFLIY